MGFWKGRAITVFFFSLILVQATWGAGEAPSADSQEDTNQTQNVMCTNMGDEGPESEIRVASWKFKEVETPLYVVIFVLVVVLAKMGWHHPIMHIIASNIPESCMLIVVGAHLGGILIAIFFAANPATAQLLPFRFSQGLFFLFLLPPIVLEAGYFMNSVAFFENIITILVYAVIGTVWNAFALGFTVWGLSAANLLSTHCTIASALLFGTICAAVDPVAVLAVFEEIHVNKLLHILVFGESLLNDAVTIVLFLVLSAFANRPFDPHTDGTIQGYEVVLGIVQFFVVVGASLLIGAVVGCLAVLMTKYSEHVHVLEPIIVLAMGYLSYILADLFAFSGIVSLIVTALMMRHYVPANVSKKSHITIKYSIKMLSTVSEMIIFMFLGLSLFDASVLKWNTGLVLWTLLFAFIFRPIGVVVLTLIMNIFRLHKIGLKDTFILSYSGLRGAVAFALALTRLFEEGFEHLPTGVQELRKEQLTAVVVLLLFTVFVQGTTIKPLVQLLHVKKESETKPTLNQTIHFTAMDHISAGVNDIQGHIGFNTLREWAHRIDVKYLRRIFERYPDAVDDEIIHTFKKLQYREDHNEQEKSTPTVAVTKSEDEGLLHKSDTDDRHAILSDLLRKSFFHPHREHLSHTLSPTDWEQREHHVEKTKFKHKIRVKRASMKIRRLSKRHTTAFGDKELNALDEELEEEEETTPSLRPRCKSEVVKSGHHESVEKSQESGHHESVEKSQEETFV